MENNGSSNAEVKETGIKQYFAGKSIPQIIFGSAAWACVLGYGLFAIGQLLMFIVLLIIGRAAGFSSDVWNTAIMYFAFFGVWIRIPELLIGLLLGFGMNGLLILFAMLHGDVHLYFDRFEIVPFFILLLAVFIQSAAEEIMCRGFIYQRVLRTYRGKFLLAVLVNGIFFGLIHMTNDGATPIAIIDIIICGIQYSAIVYYFDSLWMAMGAHAGWNFTQSILAGLPNSGNVFPYSIFRLDAASASNSFFYDVGFGVEGTIAAVLMEIVVTVAIIVIGRKMNKKHTDIWEGA